MEINGKIEIAVELEPLWKFCVQTILPLAELLRGAGRTEGEGGRDVMKTFSTSSIDAYPQQQVTQ